MQEGNKGDSLFGRCCRGDPTSIERERSFMHCWWKMPDARLWNTFHWSRVTYIFPFFSSSSSFFYQRLTIKRKNKTKVSTYLRSSSKHAMHKIIHRRFSWFRRSISSVSLSFSSSVQETTRILASSCVSFLFYLFFPPKYRSVCIVGVPYLSYFIHAEEIRN